MKKKQPPITVNVKSPCTENWQQMKKIGPGAFCQSCSKVVVDFTHMTDDQLIRFLQNRKGSKTCGRFSKQQLNRPMEHLPQKQKGGFWHHVRLFLLGALSFKAAQLPAQIPQSSPQMDLLIGEVDETQYEELKGQVLDSKSGVGLADLKIELIQIKTGNLVYQTQTDALGNFKFQFPSHLKLEEMYIRVSGINGIIKSVTNLPHQIKEGQLLITVYEEVVPVIEKIEEDEIMGIMEFVPSEMYPDHEPQSDTIRNKTLYQNLFPQERDQIEKD